MFFISLYMNSEKSENESIGNITVHLYENDFQYFDELQAVFDNADNIKLIKTTEYGGGGGSKGMVFRTWCMKQKMVLKYILA